MEIFLLILIAAFPEIAIFGLLVYGLVYVAVAIISVVVNIFK